MGNLADKIDFGQPNAEIRQTYDQLLSLALYMVQGFGWKYRHMVVNSSNSLSFPSPKLCAIQ